jgi:flagellar hook assembly protein FlgD
VEIFDIKGKSVYKAETIVAGVVNHFVWEGKDNGGNNVSSGQYVVYIKAGNEQRKATFSLIR